MPGTDVRHPPECLFAMIGIRKFARTPHDRPQDIASQSLLCRVANGGGGRLSSTLRPIPPVEKGASR